MCVCDASACSNFWSDIIIFFMFVWQVFWYKIFMIFSLSLSLSLSLRVRVCVKYCNKFRIIIYRFFSFGFDFSHIILKILYNSVCVCKNLWKLIQTSKRKKNFINNVWIFFFGWYFLLHSKHIASSIPCKLTFVVFSAVNIFSSILISFHQFIKYDFIVFFLWINRIYQTLSIVWSWW